MSVNSSFPQHPALPSSNSSFSVTCFNYESSVFIFAAFAVIDILILLPLCTFVICLGLQRWRRRRSASTTAATSHADVFTYHMVAMEMISILGCSLYLCGICFIVPPLITTGLYLFQVTSNGHLLFHILCCVDRHLAVAYPITYLGLRQRGGVIVRNISIGCAWLFLFCLFCLTSLISYSTIPSFCFSVVSILVTCFCSLSILRTLTRTGLGDNKRVSQTRMRACYTILAIMGTLLWRFGGNFLVFAIYTYSAMNEHARCGLLVSGTWFCLPSSLVLPLLFLHREGKLVRGKYKTDRANSRQGSE